MNSRPETTTLPALLDAFGAALLAPEHDSAASQVFAGEIVEDGLPALARLRVYRNNTRLIQREALSRTYTVLRRRVGDEYFTALARDYLDAHPSPAGDLHWIGAAFPDWLDTQLRDGEYHWLADLARLEWACERALVAADAPALEVAALAVLAEDEIDGTALRLHPSLQFVSSAWPIWSVWQANQPDAAGTAVDPALGAQHVAVGCVDGHLVLLSLPAEEFAFQRALAAGRPLGAAVAESALPVERLAGALGRLFSERLVIGIDPPLARATP